MSNVVKHPKTPVDHTSGAAAKPMLLDEVRARIRRLNYSIRTEDTYVDWVRRFVCAAPWQAPPTRDGGCRNRGVSGASRNATPGVQFNTKPGE